MNITGVFLCLDCSSTHRNMGVHLTFVRSVDLDEWTQSQIDAMRLGGNGNARAYFRKHGFTDLYGSKTDKKYKSKAAQSYKVELAKLVQAEAAKRGEGAAPEDVPAVANSSLLSNLDKVDEKNQALEAKAKLEAARSANGGNVAGVMESKAKLASSHAGASKLLVGGNLGTMRKPTSSSSMLLRKKSSLSSKAKPKLNKLSMKLPVAGSASAANDDDNFEDIEQTRQNVKEAEEVAKKDAEEAELAKKMKEDLIFNDVKVEDEPAPVVVTAPVVEAPKPVAPAVTIPKKPTKDENLAKLKNMTSDFFSQM